MAHDFSNSGWLPNSRPKSGSAGRASVSATNSLRPERPAVPTPAVPPASARTWDQWFWNVLELSWSDLWRSIKHCEQQLRPESPRLAGVWFTAWGVTGLSGILLLLSLLTEPSPGASHGRKRLSESRFSVQTLEPRHPADELPADEPDDHQVISAAARAEAGNDAFVQSADFVAEPIRFPTVGSRRQLDLREVSTRSASEFRTQLTDSRLAGEASDPTRDLIAPRGTIRDSRIQPMTYNTRASSDPGVLIPRATVVPRQTANRGIPESSRVRPISTPAQPAAE